MVLLKSALLYVLALPHAAYAEVAASPLRPEIDSLPGLLNAILDAVILLVFPIVVLMIVYTGFLFVTAGGDEGQVSKARTALLWTVVGALVVLGSKALSLAIENTVLEIQGAAAQAELVTPYV